MKLYCVYDRRAELANPPFSFPNNALAIRNFALQVNASNSPDRPNVLALYPDDFALYYIGEMDDKTCELITHSPSVLLSTAKELLTPPQ